MFGHIRKAVAGFVFGAGSSLGVVAADGVQADEWWKVLAAGVVTAAGVYYVPNEVG